MVDLHTHVLPGVDDGPASVEGSLDMARAAVAAGTVEMVATPHVSWDIPTSAARVAQEVAALQERLDAEGIALRLRTGGEVAISRGIELPDEELDALRLGGGSWLLVECPLTANVAGFEGLLGQLHARGHQILLAHPERSPALQRDPAMLRRLVDAGMLTQITAGSLVGQFGSTVRGFTFELVEAGLVHNLASDTHDARRRPPGLRDPIVAADAELPGLAELAPWLCEQVPRAILDGETIPEQPSRPPKRKRGLLGGLLGRRR
jgi:protein-tyrosine phosphatase